MKIMYKFLILGLLSLLTIAPRRVLAETRCDVAGSYMINVEYLGSNYSENLVLNGTSNGLTGSLELVGGLSPWTIDSGSVVGSDLELEGYYNANSMLRAHFSGKVAEDGSMSGTWNDIAPASRSGTWRTTSGVASCVQVIQCDPIGNYLINVEYLGVTYPEKLILNGTASALTGSLALAMGDLSPWTIDSGAVSGSDITLEGYFNSEPGLRTHLWGTIASDGSMSGAWQDVAPSSRAGTWATTSGSASCR